MKQKTRCKRLLASALFIISACANPFYGDQAYGAQAYGEQVLD